MTALEDLDVDVATARETGSCSFLFAQMDAGSPVRGGLGRGDLVDLHDLDMLDGVGFEFGDRRFIDLWIQSVLPRILGDVEKQGTDHRVDGPGGRDGPLRAVFAGIDPYPAAPVRQRIPGDAREQAAFSPLVALALLDAVAVRAGSAIPDNSSPLAHGRRSARCAEFAAGRAVVHEAGLATGLCLSIDTLEPFAEANDGSRLGDLVDLMAAAAGAADDIPLVGTDGSGNKPAGCIEGTTL